MRTWTVCLTEEPWAWQDDTKVVAVMSHMLGIAAHATRRYGYETLARGDVFVSHGMLANVTGLTVRQIRVVLDKLKGADELEAIRRPRGLLIRLLRYEDWQITRMAQERYAGLGDEAVDNAVPVLTHNRRGNRNVKTGNGQSHNISKGGFLITKSPLTPRAGFGERVPVSSSQLISSHTARKEVFCSQNSKTVSGNPERLRTIADAIVLYETENHDLRQKESTASMPVTIAPAPFTNRGKLEKLARAEGIFFSEKVLNTLASSSLDYIGLAFEAAIEKRDGKSNVIFPHAVARYRAEQGVHPRKDTLERLRRVLTPPAIPSPRLIPRTNCPYCLGTGNVCGEPCECVGGKHKAPDEIVRLKQERSDALRKIHEQLAVTCVDSEGSQPPLRSRLNNRL